MKRPTSFWSTLACVLLTFTASATIIIPFNDLGHLTEESSEIVIATVTNDHFYDSDEMINYSWSLEIDRSFKNKIGVGESITINGMSSRSRTEILKVLSDIKLELGKTYLLFLDKNPSSGEWTPRVMAMYVYEIRTYNNQPYYVPTIEALKACKWGDAETQFVMEVSKFNSYLQSYINNSYQDAWNEEKLKTTLALEEFHPILKAPPSHCSFLFDGANACGVTFDGVRWQVFPDDPVEIHIDTEQQYTDSDEEVTDAIQDMTDEYLGINITDEGIVGINFTPSCEDAFGNPSNLQNSDNFSSYCNGLNGGDNILVVFNDPCSQIPDLSGCSGMLAIGGLSGGCPSSDDHDGGDWLLGSNGFVVVNNGAECLTLDDFKIMMTHELTHAIGIGHIPSGNGTANMNPTCCNDIDVLDIECIDYLYPVAGSVPVTWNNISATEERGYNAINWSTSNEINNEYFQIEYSENGTDFISIGEVEGSGNSHVTKDYYFDDHHFQSNTSYYRIKQIDYDGQYQYSDIVVVNRRSTQEGVKVFPNPAADKLFISSIDPSSSIKIVDVLGNIHQVKRITSNASSSSFDISGLHSGLFYIEINEGNKSQIMSFIKM